MATKRAARANKNDAITLLTADHKKVRGLFKAFSKLQKQDGGDDEKAQLVRQACMELTVHAQLEEEIFYPAMREATDEEDLMDEAEVEHAGAKDLIAQLQSMQPGQDLYEAKFTVLGEYVNHHVEEEEGEMFRKAKRAKLDTAALGEQMMQRKSELQSQMGLSEGGTNAPAAGRATRSVKKTTATRAR